MSWICPKCETENPEGLKVCEVCDSPRPKSPVDILKEKLKKKYSENAYANFIRYHSDLLDTADKGDVDSQYKVGEWFWEHGDEYTKLDYLMIAAAWYRKAANKGHAQAQYKLASCYEKGIGVPQIKDVAEKWYRSAAIKGEERALRRYLELKYDGDAYKQVIKYRLSLLANADKNNSQAQYELGEWFRYSGNNKYKKEAITWYTKAADNGHSKSMFELGECLEYGYFTPINKTLALNWYTNAAKKGHKGARVKLMKSYLYGGIVNKNIEEALSWYRVIGGGLDASDLCNIGYAYDTGDGVTMNKEKAVEYYRKAADKGDSVAQYNMGVCCENGSGIAGNLNMAKYWYGKAAEQGNKQAQERLDRIKDNNRTANRNKAFFGFLVCLLLLGIIGFFIHNKVKKQEIIGNIINNMVYVEGGTFMMGHNDGNEKNNNDLPVYSPSHNVTLSSFYIGKYEVTQEEWECIMGYNPSRHIGEKFPVEKITWEEAQLFCKKLSSLTGLVFRLPTEAEWEYAARGGKKSLGYIYSGSNNYDEVAWCKENGDEGNAHEVGLKTPNEIGLYDMSGNVTEYCQDYFYKYGTLPLTNPVCSTYDPQLELIPVVCRGGNVSKESSDCRVYERDSQWTNAGEYQIWNAGLRIVCYMIK